MDKSRRLLVPLLPLFGVAGCDLSPDEDIVTSGGLVNKGILSQAVATAYQAGSGNLVKRVYTQVDGTFSLEDVNFDGTLYVEVRTTSQTLATCDASDGCGNFTGGLKLAGESDQNLDGQIDFGDKYFFNDKDFVLTAYIRPVGDSAQRFAVTPLTHLAAERIKEVGNVSQDNVQIVNAGVAELFGLDGTDITRVIPPDITSADQMINASQAQRMYAALNAAVASATTETTSVASVINTLATTFAENGGLLANSTDSSVVTLASIQSLANDVADVVEQELEGVDMDVVQAQIQQELTEQLAKEPDSIVKPSENPSLEQDFDGDGLSNSEETDLGTDPFDADSDDDGLIDGKEQEAGTNPLKSDTDEDGIPDGWEVQFSLNPLTNDASEDPDNDQLTNLQEFNAGSNPNLADTDGDGLSDFKEVNDFGTNPALSDTDKDGLSDPDEINVHLTDPKKADSDNDGLLDGWEIQFSLNPLNGSDALLDPDSDGVINLFEQTLGTNPNSNDTDGNGVLDGDEDPDGDGLPNLYEVVKGFNPFINEAQGDADGDSVNNITEFQKGSEPFIPNPAIEFSSDADIYANSSTGAIHIDLHEEQYITSAFDLSDLNFIDGISDTNSQQDVIIHDLDDDQYELPIRQSSSTSLLTDGVSTFQDATLDGLYMLYSSFSAQIVTGDANASSDMFIYDRLKNTSERLVRSDSTEFNGGTYPGQISQDGRYVIMKSAATNFPGITDSNGNNDIYRYDRTTGQSLLISRTNASSTTTGNGNSYEPTMSADGNRIAFTTQASNLLSLSEDADNNLSADIYFYEVSTNTMKRVSETVNASDDAPTALAVQNATISADGKYLVYSTMKDILDNTISIPTNIQIYFVDIDSMLSGSTVGSYTQMVTASYDGSNDGFGDSFVGNNIEISSDGRFVFYKSASQNLDPTDAGPSGIDDLFMWERTTGLNRVLSQHVYGDNGTTYDNNPSSHTNGMGVKNFKLNSDNTHLYAILDYGQEYTSAPTTCNPAFNYCLYKLKLFIPTQDSDNDGLSDRKEHALLSDPNDVDTDNDGLNDGIEVNSFRTSPVQPDSDGDGVNDGTENTNGTDPLDDSDL